MRVERRAGSCVWAGFALVLLAAAQTRAAPPLSFEGWQVAGPGKLEGPSRGAIGVRYESPRFEKIVVRPPQPVPLAPDSSQVRLWCARIEGDFDLRIVLRDAQGTEHAAATLTSRPEFPAIRRSAMRDWSAWRQVESIALRATDRLEDRTQPEFLKMARHVDWPGPLALAGIEISPVKDRRDNEAYSDSEAIRAGRGTLWLAELGCGATDGRQAPSNWWLEGRWRWGWNTRPRLLLDDLSRRSGAVRYALEVRKGYQGPLVWRTAGEGELPRSDPPAILAGRIELPELPAGRYFLETKTWKPGGELERTETMELRVIAGPSQESSHSERSEESGVTLGKILRCAQDDSEVPSPLAWETGQAQHVFPADTTEARLTLRCAAEGWPGRDGSAKCLVRVTDWRGRPVHESQHDRAEKLTILCTGLHEGTDYTAAAEFRDGHKLLDRVALHFGVASRARAAGQSPLPAVPSRDDLLMSRRPAAIAELYGSALAGDRGQPASDADLQEMDRWFESLPGLGFQLGSCMFGWGECEPLPGVFRWDELERRVALAQRLGIKMFLTPALWGDPLEWPRWIEWQPLLDQFGYVMTPGMSGVPEPAVGDPIRRQGAEHWLAAVAARFADNPNVLGYRTKPLNLAGENRPQAARPDAAPLTRRAFADWLAATGQPASPLARLFLLPGQNPARTGPDLSLPWRQFMDFRVHAYQESVRQITTAIRAVDPRRQIHVYRSSSPTACEAAIPLLADGAEFHDEGGPFYFQRAVESMCLTAGIPYTNEGHQFTPPSRAMIDAGFFYGSIFDRGWCWLYRWNARRHEDPRFAALPQVMQFVHASQPALAEWVAAAGDEPQVLVFGSRADKLLSAARTGFYSEIAGVECFAALFAYHQVPAHFADEYTDWVDLRRFKCVLAVGDVMPRHAVERLAEFARQGGRVVRVGDAGRFCPELPAERDLLGRQLEGAPHVKSLAAPDQDPPAPGAAFRAPQAFAPADLEAILTWAGVQRRVQSTAPGFECVCKQAASGNKVYVAVFRRFPGEYENIWYDDRAEKRWGRQPAQIVVRGLADGSWRVEKFHRDAKSLGTIRALGGQASFDAPPATVGELQLFRMIKETP